MEKFALMTVVLFLSACSGIKVQKGEPAPAQSSKPGLTWGGPAVGKVEVQKVGFHCAVKGVVLTFTDFGETEAKATESAMGSCRKIHDAAKCKFESCKPVQ